MSFKTLYKLLCGGAKFDVATAVNAAQFLKFCYALAPPDDKAKLLEHIEVFEKAQKGEAPYTGALDNPMFVGIVEAMRKFQPA